MVAFGAEEGLLQGHERSWVAHDLKNPELPEGFWQSIVKSQVREDIISPEEACGCAHGHQVVNIFSLGPSVLVMGLPRWHSGKESVCQCRRRRRSGFNT